MSIEDQLAGIDRALGIRPPSAELLQSFRDAGFHDYDAERGARLMEAFPLKSFTDVATAMATVQLPSGPVSPGAARIQLIARAAKAIDERAAGRIAGRRSPYGREPVAEEQKTPWGRPRGAASVDGR